MVLKMLISLRDWNIMPTFAKQLRNNQTFTIMKYPSITISEYYDACRNARLDCIHYIMDLLDSHENNLEVGDDDYGYVDCTQRNGDDVGLERVMRVFVDEDDNIMLELEFYGSYDIDDADTQDIVTLVVYLHQRYGE